MTFFGRKDGEEPDAKRLAEEVKSKCWIKGQDCNGALCEMWAREGGCLCKIAVTRVLRFVNSFEDAFYRERKEGRNLKRRDEELEERRNKDDGNYRGRRGK